MSCLNGRPGWRGHRRPGNSTGGARVARRATGLLLVLLLLASPAVAHNGQVALAYPVSGITIDGDLSDWPGDFHPYPIRLTEYGAKPQDAADFRAHFLVGHSVDENSLYLGIEVWDQSPVVEAAEGVAIWDSRDGCEVYVEGLHHQQGSQLIQYYLYGDVRSESIVADTGAAQVSWRHGPGSHRYEWRVDLGALGQGQPGVQTPLSLGLDVVISDKDADGSFSWTAWGRGVAKYLSGEGLGDVLLVAPGAATGRLHGWARRQGTEQGISGRRIRVRSPDNEALWLDLETDADGNFAIAVPEGDYLVDLGLGLFTGARRRVKAAHSTEATFAVPPAAGLSTPAGTGRRVDVGDGFRHGVWHSLSFVDGLAGNEARAILQGQGGYLWIGTEAGLSRFDGRYMVNFGQGDGLVDGDVRCLAQDSTGALWIGTNGGLSRYDGERFTSFTARDGLISDQVRAVALDRDGTLWIGTELGLARYDGWGFTNYTQADGLPGSPVRSVFVGALGDVWMGIWGGGVARYDGEEFATLTAADGLLDNRVRPVIEGRGGDIWIGCETGLCRYDGQGFEYYTQADGLVDDEIWSLYEDQSGDLWIGTYSSGISRFDGERFVNYTGRDGLAGDEVRACAEDREGVVWVAAAGGVSRRDERFTSFTTEDGLSHNLVRAILEDRHGQLWFGTGFGNSGGLTRYDGERFRRFSAADGLPHHEVWSLLEDRLGSLWVGTSRGLGRFDGNAFTSLGLGPGRITGLVSSLVEDGEGDLWMATDAAGVVRFDGETLTRFTVDDGLVNDNVTDMVVGPAGDLWLTTFGGGVCRLHDGMFTAHTQADGLPSDEVYTAAPDSGRIWFGTTNGLSRYEEGHFTTYTTEDGLAGNRVRDLLVDDRGHLWIGTEAGLSRFDGQVFQTLLRRDGLASSAVRSLLQDRDGAIWIGTIGGVTRYTGSDTPPPVLLTDVIVDRRLGPVESVEMRTTQDLLAIEFTGISFETRPEAMGYRYRLAGFDEEWQVGYVGRAEYHDLPIGEYTFEVRAIDRDLSYSREPAQVRVVVRPAYGRLTVMAALLLALGLIAWQATVIARGHRHLQRTHDELEIRVEERTAELKATQNQLIMREKMASLGSLVAGVAHELNNPVGAVNSAADVCARCLGRIAELVAASESLEELRGNRRFQQAMRMLEKNSHIAQVGTGRIQHIVSTLRNFARLDEADLQEADLQEGLESTLTLLHHQLTDTISVIEDYGDLPTVQCYPQELNQVFMNLLSNAIHSLADEDGGEIRIATYADAQCAYVAISDTGCGISPEIVERVYDPGFTTKGVGVGTGLGLAISYQIVQKHHGELRVESELGHGSTFTVVLPHDQRQWSGETT